MFKAEVCSVLDPSPLVTLSLVTGSVPSDLCALSSVSLAEAESKGDVVWLVSEESVALQKEKKTKPKKTVMSDKHP